MRGFLFFVALAVGAPAVAAPVVILTRDGAVTEVSTAGAHKVLATAPGAVDMAVCPSGEIWVLVDSVVRRVWPARQSKSGVAAADVMGIACSAERYVTTKTGDVFALVVPKRSDHRARVLVGHFDKVRFMFSNEQQSFVATDKFLSTVDATEQHAVVGLPIAAAATREYLYVINRDGNLTQINRKDKTKRDLPLMGLWWGALGLAPDGDSLYAVTQVGKLWHLWPLTGKREIVDMDGWREALSIALSRNPD